MLRLQHIGTDDKPSAMPSLLEHCRGAEEEDRRSMTGKLTVLRRWVMMAALLLTIAGAEAQTTITSLSDITDANGNYVLGADITGGTADVTTFRGTLDGGYHTISGMSAPLFENVDGAIVKNVMLDDVSVTTTGNAGAIANTASGATRIYNCGVLSGTVSGSRYVGSILGELQGNTRVINCFSYATVRGGTWAAGIVGYNPTATTSSTTNTTNGINVAGMIMNCMFYGEVASGTGIAPVYGGTSISNVSNLNTFNYFRFMADYCQQNRITAYNCALGAEERYLTRFEFYRYILNSNRALAAWYATGSTANGAQMAKWVMDFRKDGSGNRIYPYPILKPQGIYPSIINIDAEHATTQIERNKGGLLGTLSVSISQGDNAPEGATIKTSSLTLNVTDKDPENYNFNYRKVQLPYYNQVGTGNYTNNKVVTGWIITFVTGGTTGSFTTGTDATLTDGVVTSTPYNFANRQCTNKDLYSVSGRVFAQGAYYNVPEGVTAITIKPYWGTAVYLSDPNYDVTYNTSYTASNVTAMGTRYNNNVAYTINGSSQRVYTALGNAINNIAEGGTVYDHAIVLVGNYHDFAKNNRAFSGDKKAYTVMSADLDNDNEPDNTFFYQHTDRLDCSPVRFDFLNWPGVGMAQKLSHNDTPQMPNQGIFRPRGWFEVTGSCIVRFTEFEYDYPNTKKESPLILLGGIFEQITSNNSVNAAAERTSYIHVGDNVWFKLFNNGVHADKQYSTRHIPISVTGGDYDRFYLSGMFRHNADTYNDNAECYVDGGRFGELASGGMEQINGDVAFVIDNADITSFFGGGINAAKPVQGNISVIINNSHVGTYCGGPKFGDMAEKKTVNTHATGSTFDTFFGAGYGGTAYNRIRTQNAYNQQSYSWNTWDNGYGRVYVSGNGGISVSFETEFFAWAGGGNTNNVGRFYVNYASLSLANTNDVTTTLTDCTIEENFYGGGNLGSVAGNIHSTLTDCNVKGSVFGAGFSATVPTVDVFPAATDGNWTVPSYNKNVGVYNEPVYPEPVTYTWSNTYGTLSNNSNSCFVDDGENHWIRTNVDLSDLGKVTGNVTLTVNGESVVGQSIYGGGNEGSVSKTNASATNGNITVTVTGSTEVGPNDMQMTTPGGPDDAGHVFGAGRGKISDVVDSPIGSVAGNIDLTIGGTAFIKGSVYGGGENGIVGGNTHVTIEGECQIGNGDGVNRRYTAEEWATGKYENSDGLPECAHWPYDAAHNGDTYDKYAGTVGYDAKGGSQQAKDGRTFYGNVFAGGSGYYPYAPGLWNKTAGEVKGNTTLDITGGHILTSVYGGNELTDVGKFTFNSNGTTTIVSGGNTTINMTGGTVGVPRTDAQMRAHPVTCYVFGAGKGDPRVFFNQYTNVANTTVNITGNARIYGSTFGGGEDGHVIGNAVTNIGDVKIGAATTATNGSNVIIGTTGTSGVDGNVFGGGRGYSGLALTIGLIQGNCETNISNGKIYGSVFGGGRSASVGTYQVLSTDTERYGKMQSCIGSGGTDDSRTITINETQHNHGHIAVNISGGEIGHLVEGGLLATTDVVLATDEKHPSIGDVFGGGKGLASDRRFGLVKDIDVRVYDNAKVYGSVYGGGEISSVGDPDEVAVGGVFKTGIVNVSVYGNAQIGTEQNSIGIDGKGYVYGSGKGMAGSHYSEEAYVKYSTVTIGEDDDEDDLTPRIYGSVFGGGEDGHVRKDAAVYIKSGTIGSPLTTEEIVFDLTTGTSNTIIYRGNVYAGGRGVDHDSDPEDGDVTYSTTAGAVYGNAKVEMTGGHVYHNIYGSGSMASVGTVSLKDGKPDYAEGTWTANTGNVEVTVTGGTVGDNTPGHEGRNNGRVFGAGRGLAGNIGGEESQMEYVHSTKVTIGGDAKVLGAVFGGGENGHVKTDTEVNIGGDCVIGSPLLLSECLVSEAGAKGNAFRGNVFGGGRGVDASGSSLEHRSFTAGRVFGNTTVNVGGGLIYRAVYGGGMLANVGNPQPKRRQIAGTETPDDPSDDEFEIVRNDAGTDDDDTDDYIEIDSWPQVNPDNPDNGVATVNITGGWIGNVSESNEPLSSEYGEPGRNNGAVFGSGAGFMATTGAAGQYSQLAYVYRSYVNISNTSSSYPTHIRAAVFGGGENGHVWENATVNVSGGTIGNAPDGGNGGDFAFAGNVFGSGRGMNVTFPADQHKDDIVSTTAGWVKGNTTVNIWAADASKPPIICRDVYGGGNLGSVGNPAEVRGTAGDDGRDKFGFKTGLATVNILGGNVYGNVYGGSRGQASMQHEYHDMSYVKNSIVNITGTAHIVSDEHTDGDDGGYVYGGGNAGHLRRNTEVNIGGERTIQVNKNLTTSDEVTAAAGGTIGQTLFGAGRGSEISATAGVVNHDVEVNINPGSIINGDVYGGGAIANSNCHDLRNTDPETEAPVSEPDLPCSTKVNLLGGLIKGDAYGGGQGINYDASKYSAYSEEQQTVIKNNCAALVHGDVTVTLDGTAFELRTTTDDDENTVPTSGRVFGCNNINGSPKGTVVVIVKKTVALDGSGNVKAKPTKTAMDAYTNTTQGTYELEAVYGGGNLAAYEPETSVANASLAGTGYTSHTPLSPLQVVIDGCGDTSIKYVYGGGNAAPVPSSDVLVLGTHEIADLFGGGNGKDKYLVGSTWTENQGADVGKKDGNNYGSGNTNVMVYGGTIHRVFGGSNTLGDIVGSSNVKVGDTSQQTCELCIGEVYAGGNNADQTGGGNLTMGCVEYMPIVYGGANNADFDGNVVLTITGGRYDKVFGGNNHGGALRGSITVNIEEKGCLPIEIGELYGGGNEAPYSIYGYNDNGTVRTAAVSGVEPYDNPQVNIISATSIGTIYGGGYGVSATMVGSPHVNINMMPGKVDGTYKWNEGTSYYNSPTNFPNAADRAANNAKYQVYDPSINTSAAFPLTLDLGTIGTVFGGGNAAMVMGDTYLNIGDGKTYTVTENGQLVEKTRADAQITGNVFGGGNNAEVTGNTNVVIGKQ